ncbi:MAG: Uma2 family endonuclease [Candidatus Competibacteraceae bacterium]
MTATDFTDPFNTLPEAKLELIDGRLIVGNGLAGTRLLLAEILTGWGAAAAIALADRILCWEALRRVYPEAPRTDDHGQPSEPLQAWVSQFAYQPPVDLLTGRRGEDVGHQRIRQTVRYQLWAVTQHSRCERSLGPDFVMRLGDNGFTPDALLCRGESLHRLHDYYLEGPADLVIEILLPDHTDQDREVKRRYYEQSGVPEYWLIDPDSQQVTYLRRLNGAYRPCYPAADGSYRPAPIPGLAFYPERLWTFDPYQGPFEPVVFTRESQPEESVAANGKGGLGYGSLPFAPRLGLEPTAIHFDEYISWCPEAKFEYADNRIDIAGMREFLGLLLMTVGLMETITLLPPCQWIEALLKAEEEEHHDAARKEDWWRIAREAAVLLRERFGAHQVAVAGDLVRSRPLNYWSEIELIAQDLPASAVSEANWALYQAYKAPQVHLLEDWRVEHRLQEGAFVTL